MQQVHEYFLSVLRNKDTSNKEFRRVSYILSRNIAMEACDHIKLKKIQIQTPLTGTTGLELTTRVVLIPILRAGMAMLEPFLEIFPQALVGVVGLCRNAVAQALWYYKHLPDITEHDQIIILDPMIATGGSAYETLKMLQTTTKTTMKTVIFANILSAKEGIMHVNKHFPDTTIITLHTDEEMNDKKIIVPGLGDFGDRYFGTETTQAQLSPGLHDC